MTTATEATVTFTANQGQFVRALRWVKRAADGESKRYALGSVCLEYRNGCLDLVATDGRRIHWAQVKAEVKVEHDDLDRDGDDLADDRFLLPMKAVQEAAQWPTSGKREVEILVADRTAIINGTKGRVTKQEPQQASGKLVEGRYPDWRRIYSDLKEPVGSIYGEADAIALLFPEDVGIEVSLNGRIETGLPVKGAVERASRYGNERKKLLGLTHKGKASACLDRGYMRDALNLGSMKVHVEFTGSDTPVVIRQPDGIAVLMPRA